MIENSSAGLTMLGQGHDVVVTREEHHQGALTGYSPRGDGRARRVAVELCFASIAGGTHAEQRGIEVRLDGHRVGELTHRMSQRYAPVVEDVLRGGGRPGCVALVGRGRRGLEMELRLPVVDGAVPVPPPVPPGSPVPSFPRSDTATAAGGRRNRTPYLVGAGLVALVLVVGANIGGRGPGVATTGGSGAPNTSTTASASTATAAPIPVPPAVTSTNSPATPTATARPRSQDQPPQPPQPQPTPQARAPRTQAPKPAPQPAPANDCDPNYSGCVPIASDVDCAGGSGNGPAYVRGPVRVTGSDIYGLDADHNGTGCES